MEEVIRHPLAFWVMNKPIVDGLWPVIGTVLVSPELREAPWFFEQDPTSGKLTVGGLVLRNAPRTLARWTASSVQLSGAPPMSWTALVTTSLAGRTSGSNPCAR